MTDLLKHRFVSPKLDGADTQQVQPSHWNDGHRFQGGNAGEVLTRDPTDLSFGAKWAPSLPEVPSGGVLGDVLTRDPAVPDFGSKWAPPTGGDPEVPSGGVDGDVLTRDFAVPTFGSKWAAIAGGGGLHTVLTDAATGTVNNWAPTGWVAGRHTLIRWTGAAHLTVTGLAGGTVGQTVTICNYGTAAAVLAFGYLSTASAVGNRFANSVVSGPTPVGARGYITYLYGDIGGGETGWILIGHEQGAWITPAFNAADYSTPFGGGTWTVTAGQVQFQYRLAGNTLQIQCQIGPTTTTGAPVSLARKIPGGMVCAPGAGSASIIKTYVVNVQKVGLVALTQNNDLINFYGSFDLVAWGGGANNYVIGQYFVVVS